MNSNIKVFMLVCVIAFSITGCTKKTPVNGLTSDTSESSITTTDSTTSASISQGETSTTAIATTSQTTATNTKTSTKSTIKATNKVTSTTTTTTKALTTTATADKESVNVPVINSPFSTIEYVDCTFADNCPVGQKCHVENAEIMYDPISKKVICTKHLALSFFDSSKQYNVSWPTANLYLFKRDDFVVNVHDAQTNVGNTCLINIKNNTIKKLPYSFYNVSPDLKKGTFQYTVYDFNSEKTISLPVLSDYFISGFQFSPSGKFAVGPSGSNDKPDVIVDVQKEHGITFTIENDYRFVDEDRYVISKVNNKFKIYDTTNGIDVTNKAQPKNPYFMQYMTRYNVVNNEAVNIPNINPMKVKSRLELDGNLYVYQSDGYIYKTEIATLKQEKFPLPEAFKAKLESQVQGDQINQLIMDVDSRSNSLYFLVFLRR